MIPEQSRFTATPIETDFSIYLDLIRFIAAFCVFISHSTQFHLYNGYVPLDGFGHDSVIVFFVLSGLVIFSTAARPNETWKTYVVARMSRIYSVAIPAIILCYIVKGTATFLKPDLWSGWSSADLSIAMPISALLFLLESWQFQVLPWNAPYWSLCYEVWYYVIFGAIFFIRNAKIGAAVALAAALIAGPAIMLLFPVWLFGVWVARHRDFLKNARVASWVIFFGSFALFILINYSDIAIPIREYLHHRIPGFWRLSASQRFLTDYAVGLLVVLNFAAFRAIRGYFSTVLRASAPVIRYFAGYTFSLYLYHYPMVRFCEAIFPNTTNSIAYYIFTMVVIFGLCLLLGHFTEKQKWLVRTFVVGFINMAARTVGRLKSPASVT